MTLSRRTATRQAQLWTVWLSGASVGSSIAAPASQISILLGTLVLLPTIVGLHRLRDGKVREAENCH